MADFISSCIPGIIHLLEVIPMRKWLSLLLCTLFMLTLSGCNVSDFLFKSPESLYALPRLSEEYTSLQTCLQELLDSGLEYAPPLTGSTTQPVHLRDLDGDGEDEAIAFLRDTSASESPLKLYIFKKNSEGVYETACVIAGNGTNINSALACQLVGSEDTPLEIVVSWQTSSTVYTLSAYSLANYQPTELMTPASYTRYSALDLDQDGENELVLLNVDNSGQALSTASYYDKSADRLVLASTASLSASLSAIDRTQVGILSDGTPVLYVTGTILSNVGSSSSQITDLLALSKGTLSNLTLNPETLNSDATIRYNLTNAQDINGDGVLELPSPYTIPAYEKELPPDSFYGISWQQFDANGTSTFVCSTYYNSADGWYLELPDDWQGHFSLARKDIAVSNTNERGVFFYYRDGPSKGKPFLAIYKNTGSNRMSRAVEGNRILLNQDSSACYSLELLDSSSEWSLSPGDLEESFHLILTDWSSD